MRIYIENLKFQTIIGILDFEREIPQDVVIDTIIDYSYSNGDFINYADVRDLIFVNTTKNAFLAGESTRYVVLILNVAE